MMSEFLQATQLAEARQALGRLKANMRLAVIGKDTAGAGTGAHE